MVESPLMTLLLKPFFPSNTDPSQIKPSGSGTIAEDDQLPSDDEDEIEEETEDEMIKNPQDPVIWLSIVFEKHQDLRALTPSEYDELQFLDEQLYEDYTEDLSKLECSAAFAQLVKMIHILKRKIIGS